MDEMKEAENIIKELHNAIGAQRSTLMLLMVLFNVFKRIKEKDIDMLAQLMEDPMIHLVCKLSDTLTNSLSKAREKSRQLDKNDIYNDFKIKFNVNVAELAKKLEKEQ